LLGIVKGEGEKVSRTMGLDFGGGINLKWVPLESS